jgi:multimeric flavodoxin WrbA
MKVLGISGSPRGKQSNTKRLVERVLEGAQSSGAEIELIDLSGLKLEYCIACGRCYVTGVCIHKDDFASIMEKMYAADGLVLGSPVYFNSVTAQLKTVFDRLSDAIHCQRFLGKYACSVATSGGPEFDMVLDYMTGVLVRLGCTVVGEIGAAIAVPGSLEAAEKDSVAIGADLVQAMKDGRTCPDQEEIHKAMHERFKRLVSFNQAVWTHEVEYWTQQGWM